MCARAEVKGGTTCSEGHTQEHFPDLHMYTLVDRDGDTVLRNVTASGQVQEFADLVSHGGVGARRRARVRHQVVGPVVASDSCARGDGSTVLERLIRVGSIRRQVVTRGTGTLVEPLDHLFDPIATRCDTRSQTVSHSTIVVWCLANRKRLAQPVGAQYFHGVVQSVGGIGMRIIDVDVLAPRLERCHRLYRPRVS
jgi:hypothetical protein